MTFLVAALDAGGDTVKDYGVLGLLAAFALGVLNLLLGRGKSFAQAEEAWRKFAETLRDDARHEIQRVREQSAADIRRVREECDGRLHRAEDRFSRAEERVAVVEQLEQECQAVLAAVRRELDDLNRLGGSDFRSERRPRDV